MSAAIENPPYSRTSSSRAAGGPRWRRTAAGIFIRILSICLFLGLWQLASVKKWDFLIHFENIPAPTEVVKAATKLGQSPKFAAHIRNSLIRILAGFGIATITGIGLGLLIGRFRLANEGILPPLEILRPIPAVAWIPLAILMFSSPEASMIFITFIGAFFPILLSTIHGVENVDKRLVFASLTLGAGPLAVFREVILPGALPAIITGLSIGMGTSWFSLVTAEMISGQYGVGYYTWEAYNLQNYPDIILGMIVIGVMGLASSWLIKKVGRRLTPWFDFGGNAT
ncbi:MAG TPA: ABC transporter permease [Chthoniobacterales bacterium]